MKILLIFAILTAGCSEEHEIKRIYSPFMTISDAIPVQFWVNGVETYNQKEVCGINSVCYCQPFQCDDEIRIQFTDSEYDSFELQILDSSGAELTSLTFTEISLNIWELSFIPNELNICDENIRLVITPQLIENGSFTSTLLPWTNESSGTSWSVVANKASVSLAAAGESKRLTQNVDFYSGIEYTLLYTLDLDNANNPNITIRLVNGITSVDIVNSSIGTNGVFTVVFTPTQNWTSIDFKITNEGDYTLDDISIVFDAATSDCIDIKTSHDCTALIRYDNAKDFAGIEYSDFSPTAEFYLRIPAVFFHERNIEEEENFELSSENMVRLRNEIKVKRLLEVGFMPDYMHRKLLLILAHDTVEIDGEEWIKRDPYEKEEPGNKRYPLKKASVLLTQKDYIKRNIL